MIPALLAATVHRTIVFYERFKAGKIHRNPPELQEDSFVLSDDLPLPEIHAIGY